MKIKFKEYLKFISIITLCVIGGFGLAWLMDGFNGHEFSMHRYCPNCEKVIIIDPRIKTQCDNCGYKFVLYKDELKNN